MMRASVMAAVATLGSSLPELESGLRIVLGLIGLFLLVRLPFVGAAYALPL